MTSRYLVVAVAGAAFVVAGCGGGGKSDNATDKTPTAREPLSAAASRLAKAAPRGDCKELIRLMLHSIQRGRGIKPDSPPTAGECRYMKNEARRYLRGYKVTKVREFGPSGFSEGSGAEARRGLVGVVWLLDADGSWKAVFDAVFRPQIGVAPTRGPLDANARALVAAVRARDCNEFWRLGHVASRFVRGSGFRRNVFCKSFPNFYRDPKSAFAQIQADRGAEPKELGRTRDFGFYGLQLKSARYMAIVLAGPIGGIADKEQRQHAVPAVLEFLTVRQPR